jgi:hypothetical protein
VISLVAYVGSRSQLVSQSNTPHASFLPLCPYSQYTACYGARRNTVAPERIPCVLTTPLCSPLYRFSALGLGAGSSRPAPLNSSLMFGKCAKSRKRGPQLLLALEQMRRPVRLIQVGANVGDFLSATWASDLVACATTCPCKSTLVCSRTPS